MINISNSVQKKQTNFWNGCVFHPTDAIEDPWGRRILDAISEDRAIHTVRLYSMFEDIVYIGDNGEICYDFRLSDLRLDYLVSHGFRPFISYGGIPDCIASSTANKTSVSKNKTRYKGKMWNSAPPKDYAVWEELCYEYTKHNVERYGEEEVSTWLLHCFNEPDIALFFLSELSNTEVEARLAAYCPMYEGFVRGALRASKSLTLGGPALAGMGRFLRGFLDFVREKELPLDFISMHAYGTGVVELNENGGVYNCEGMMKIMRRYAEILKEKDFQHVPVVMDEWGMSSSGFYNREECPALIARETEVNASYFIKLICEIIREEMNIELLCICLSGQHEMIEDFSGFRNFFTLNFIRKPIYNAYVLAGKLHENLLAHEQGENIHVLPTASGKGEYATLITYASECFDANLPALTEALCFEADITGKQVEIYCIDLQNTNPYRVWERMGMPDIEGDVLKALKEEGRLKPVKSYTAKENTIPLRLTANSVYFVSVH